MVFLDRRATRFLFWGLLEPCSLFYGLAGFGRRRRNTSSPFSWPLSTLHIPTANYSYSTIDPRAKPGDRMIFEGEVIHVDEELGASRCRCLGASRAMPAQSNW